MRPLEPTDIDVLGAGRVGAHGAARGRRAAILAGCRSGVAALVALSAALLLIGCRVDATVSIDVSDDASGTVTIDVVADRVATERLGDPSKNLRLEDFATAGWKVSEPIVDAGDGTMRLSAQRRFASARELDEVLASIGANPEGPEGGIPFIGATSLSLTSNSTRTDYHFDGRLHLGGGLAQFSDPALTKALGGLPVGRTDEELKALGHDPDAGIGTLRVRLRMPGEAGQHTGSRAGDWTQWVAPLGSDKTIDTQMVAEYTSTNGRGVVMRWLGIGLVLAAVALGFVGVIRRR